ncbi:MAG: serine/threonine-protein kinase [Comamonas sp.]|nr:serine/threonine-protein kinase [Comamonas sp.]
MHTLHDLTSGALNGARHVRLTDLGLRTFPPQLLELADTLEVLDLSGNQLSTLPDDFARFTRLRIVFASNNPFTSLPVVLGQCPQLEMVGFKACRIAHVPENSLPARLRWLILTDNQLTQLPASLGQRPRLQKLMLSCNQLSALPDLSACHRLELLRIASNQFTHIPANLLQLPALAWPALAGNPMTQKSELSALSTQGLEPYFNENFHMHELLGEGASGHIYRATHASTGKMLAVKVFKAAATSDGTPQSELAAGLAAGQHPNLLTPLARVEDLTQGKLAMALPLLPAGFVNLAGPPSFASCTRDVYAPDARCTAASAEHLLTCIRSAVEHLHAHDVLHGDLYAHNILWNPQTGEALLSDLGAALLTRDLPDSEVKQLQAMEWRAFAHLAQEVYALCAEETK